MRNASLYSTTNVVNPHFRKYHSSSPSASPSSPAIFSNVNMPPPHLSNDVTLAQHLLRTPSIRAFMLNPPPLATELELLTTKRPHFVISTSEVQTGALEGTIAMHYLGLPAFSDSDGLSGGLVVTSYAARTHPLHAPAVMADVRVGRYVRDNRTGDWCIITQSHRDHVTRLQYVRVRNGIIRERICLTCDSAVFDRGDILASVLFRCHDKELRTCACPTACRCRRPVKQRAVKGLEDVALSVMQEGAACWKGKVRVTVLSQNPRNGDIDECMDITSSVQPSMDSALASQMARLAIIEKVNSATCVPRRPAARDHTLEHESGGEPQHQFAQQQPAVNVANVSMDSFDNVFMQSEGEVADHFLVPPENNLPVLEEIPMLPADPSTLPAGVEMCLDGMDFEDDGWGSFINSDRDATSGSSEPSSSEPSQTFEVSKEEPFPVEQVAFTREESEDEELCAGYHGCGDSVTPVGIQTAKPSPVSLSQRITKPLQQEQPQLLLPQQTPKQKKAQRQASMPEPVFPQRPILGEPIPQRSGPLHSIPRQPIPQQPISREAISPANVPQQSVPQQSVPQHVLPSATPHMYPIHVLPMIPTPQPWQQPLQQPNPATKQEGLESISIDSSDEKCQVMPHGRKLAPRPTGVNVSDGFIWQMGNSPANQLAIAARLEAMEKERKVEERRKKNRQAAARSNARKKDLMDGIRAQIHESKAQEAELRKRESSLQEENRQLRERVGRVGLAM